MATRAIRKAPTVVEEVEQFFREVEEAAGEDLALTLMEGDDDFGDFGFLDLFPEPLESPDDFDYDYNFSFNP